MSKTVRAKTGVLEPQQEAEPTLVKFEIGRDCIACEVCVPVCPTKSIFFTGKIYAIDDDTCEGCGICARICPVEVIKPRARPRSER